MSEEDYLTEEELEWINDERRRFGLPPVGSDEPYSIWRFRLYRWYMIGIIVSLQIRKLALQAADGVSIVWNRIMGGANE